MMNGIQVMRYLKQWVFLSLKVWCLRFTLVDGLVEYLLPILLLIVRVCGMLVDVLVTKLHA